MTSTLEVLFSPADYQARRAAGFAGSVCVVFDVLRATSVMLTGLANGAKGFIPVEEISEAIAMGSKHPRSLLAGERDGLRITAAQSGGVEFDLGNSPREYTPERVHDRTIISTTTNGTRAFRACASAQTVAVSAFLNLTATAKWLSQLSPRSLVLVCAGTAESPALEDILCAGALCDSLTRAKLEDSAEVARRAYCEAKGNLLPAIASSRNGARLLSNPGLREDVEWCLRQDVYDFAAVLGADGVVRRRVE
jgi:2-phosphosulfolactate phosphatase